MIADTLRLFLSSIAQKKKIHTIRLISPNAVQTHHTTKEKCNET